MDKSEKELRREFESILKSTWKGWIKAGEKGDPFNYPVYKESPLYDDPDFNFWAGYIFGIAAVKGWDLEQPSIKDWRP